MIEIGLKILQILYCSMVAVEEFYSGTDEIQSISTFIYHRKENF